MKIIINADDLGLNSTVNNAIDIALATGSISSSTILANTSLLSDVLKIVNKYPQASFGVHLNLTEGKSITCDTVLQKIGIIDADGCFLKNHSMDFRKKGFGDGVIQDAVKREWRSQIKLLVDSGIPISHFDGHHHCHSWLGLENILCELMLEFGISKTRNRYYAPLKGDISGLIKKSLSTVTLAMGLNAYKYDNRLCNAIRDEQLFRIFTKALAHHDLCCPQYFGAYQSIANLYKEGKLSMQSGTMELMCHPGHPNYAKEYEMVLHELLPIDGVTNILISYNEL